VRTSISPDRHGERNFTVSSPVTYMARVLPNTVGPTHRLVEERGDDSAVCDVFVSVEMTWEGHPSENFVPSTKPRPDAGAVLFPAEEHPRSAAGTPSQTVRRPWPILPEAPPRKRKGAARSQGGARERPAPSSADDDFLFISS